jgi:hypothetical protein
LLLLAEKETEEIEEGEMAVSASLLQERYFAEGDYLYEDCIRPAAADHGWHARQKQTTMAHEIPTDATIDTNAKHNDHTRHPDPANAMLR